MSPRLVRLTLAVAVFAAGVASAAWLVAPGDWNVVVDARANLEARKANGERLTPGKQSPARGRHGLESVKRVELTADGALLGRARLLDVGGRELLRLVNLPLDTLVPRLRYRSPRLDAFDSFNLMLAEYSRNGQSMPWGPAGDDTTHFESEAFTSTGANARPARIALVNNCLTPGLWELSAKDQTGEIWHAWLDLPRDRYFELAARANGITPAEARDALNWRTQPVVLDLSRLRRSLGDEELMTVSAVSLEQPVSASTPESRAKLDHGFAEVLRPGGASQPSLLGDLTAFPARFVSFVPPGLYSASERRTFDVRWLRDVRGASSRRVAPLTSYTPRGSAAPERPGAEHVELRLHFGVGRSLVLGNLPLSQLVEQEDFGIHGFGVGVLAPDTPVARTHLLTTQGPAPSFAYLTEERAGREHALNSHEAGLEQIFVRARPFGARPHWQITLTSYERITDLARYEVAMPPSLVEEARAASRGYAAPAYLTYRDDARAAK